MTRISPFLLTLKTFPIRTLYCLFLLTFAFYSFVYLRSIDLAHSGALAPSPILSVGTKGNSLPIAMLSELEAMPEIAKVSPTTGLGAYLAVDTRIISAWGVDPVAYTEIYGLVMDAETEECFFNTRTGAVTTNTLEALSESPKGAILPLLSTYLPNADGTRSWPLHFCGLFEWPEVSEQPPGLLFNYRYLEASPVGLPLAQFVAWSTHQPKQVAEHIDRRYANSAFPTISMPTDEATRLYARRVADMGKVAVFLIMSVFLSVLFVSRSLYAQSIKERIEDFRVLHAIGFGKSTLGVGVLFELLLLFWAGCVLGNLLATMSFPLAFEFLETLVGEFVIGWRAFAESMALASIIVLTLGVPIPFGVWNELNTRGGHA